MRLREPGCDSGAALVDRVTPSEGHRAHRGSIIRFILAPMSPTVVPAPKQGPPPPGPKLAIPWRYATANLRPLPDFVILGTQRGGTTSLYMWLRSHPNMSPALKKEIHFFDVHYDKGTRWYRSRFPLARRGQITGDASPYMLFHPLAPARAAQVLPERTRFIILLREPVQRTISHYWFSRRLTRWETEPIERAIALEPERLAGETDRVKRGERSFAHATYSYLARSEYAGQVESWFNAVGRERILIIESEKLYSDPAATTKVIEWLGLDPHHVEYPAFNQSKRLDTETPELLAQLHEHFEPHNRKLFDLLGYELWTDLPEA
jgi:hypothetical protein